MNAPGVTLTIGIVAGEASGDRLGAGLMRALSRRINGVRFVGVGGEAMRSAGLESLADMGALAVNGFTEPLIKLPGLARLLFDLRRRLWAERPAAFIGVDFNVFNLLLEGQLKRSGVPTAHYVSPSVYAWRRGRVRRIGRSADLLLALFPFEPAYYQDTGLNVAFVGHPLADAIGLDEGAEASRKAVRSALGIGEEKRVIALLPGSRLGEINQHLDLFLDAATLLANRLGSTAFLIPCVRPDFEPRLERAAAARSGLEVRICQGDAHQALTACDGAIVKSGTGTLEAMLLRRPMVVAYRLGPLSHALARLLVRTEFVALPNLLAGRELVPERLQGEATPEKLADALWIQLDKPALQAETLQAFSMLHLELRRDANERAADAVMALLGDPPSQT
ncbi:MAG: lipid-A-disaccharide synthase [Gammaproteobacteria bacterium]|nr:lipid-A-disaccharide synthase [Gammaproteobacteria bacterium]